MAWSDRRPVVEARALRYDLRLAPEDKADPFAIAEAKGIEVVHLSIGENDEVEGAFLRRNQRDFILVNAAKKGRRQRFTVAHELGHAVLLGAGDGEFVDTAEDLDSGSRAVERDANIFAVELLMPEAGAMIIIEAKADQDAAGAIARAFDVSPVSAAIRVCELRGLGKPEKKALFDAVTAGYQNFWREQNIPKDVKPRASEGVTRSFRNRADQLREIGVISPERYAELVERPLQRTN